MDALAFYRRQNNLPALSLNWGRWREVGQGTKDNRGERMDARGFTGMKSAEGLAILGSLLLQTPPQISAMSFSFAKWSRFFPEVMHSSFFAYLSQEEETLPSNDSGPQMTREMLLEMENEQRQQALSLYIEKQIAQVLGHPSLKLEQHQHLHRLGIDSLTAVELKNRVNADLGTSISAVTFLQGVSFGQLTDQIEALI
jgi:myxalamid-type polyketide synthase MxaE and MxaD